MGRGSIDAETVATLQRTRATRAEVLLRLGPPSLSLNNERAFVYDWSMFAGVAGIATVAGGPGGPVARYHSVVVEFEDDGRTSRAEMRENLFGKREEVGSLLKRYSPQSQDSTKVVAVLDPLPEVWAHFDAGRSGTRGISLAVGEFRDARFEPYTGSLVGQQLQLGGDIVLPEIRSRRPVNELVRACVVKQLRDDGYEIAEGKGDRELTGSIDVFRFDTARFRIEVDVTLEVRSAMNQAVAVRRYRFTYKPRLLQLEMPLRESLESFQQRVASDVELRRLLSGLK